MKTKKDGESIISPFIKTEIRRSGNWNYKNVSNPVYSKPVGIFKINDTEISWSHEDIFQLIELYHDVDVESIKMIEDPKTNTGAICGRDIPFLEKLEILIKCLKNKKIK